MSAFTHVFHEQGNGFPEVGDEVIVERDMGWHQIKQVASISSIHTHQWESNWIYLTLEDADRDYNDLDDDEAEEAFQDLHSVAEISADESEDA